MTYGYFKDLSRRAASDKVLRSKAFNIAKNPKYNGYQHGIATMVFSFLYKTSPGGAVTCANKCTIKSELMSKQSLLDLAHVAKVSDRR